MTLFFDAGISTPGRRGKYSLFLDHEDMSASGADARKSSSSSSTITPGEVATRGCRLGPIGSLPRSRDDHDNGCPRGWEFLFSAACSVGRTPSFVVPSLGRDGEAETSRHHHPRAAGGGGETVTGREGRRRLTRCHDGLVVRACAARQQSAATPPSRWRG